VFSPPPTGYTKRVRRSFPATLVLVAAAGCGGGAEAEPGAARVDRCTERFLDGIESDGLPEDEREVTRRYVERTYCSRFEQEGWVHEDGTLSIDAYTGSYEAECGESRAGEEPVTVPCDELEDNVLDCAILHHVPKEEVRAFVEGLGRTGRVECDDGTPVHELGVG
jgi:hypothetical protein